MKNLFNTTELSGVELKNRFMRSATWENIASQEGYLTGELVEVYQNLAQGGVGTIITGYAFVIEDEQPNPGMLGIYNDSFIDEYRELTELVHNEDSNIILQIAYGGSQTTYQPDNREIWGPSAVENLATGVTPTKMTKENIQELVDAFAKAGLRAKQAGFDGVEFHGAHGYLLSQFLTPYYNRRGDEYGGSIENRARIIFEVYEAIREKVGKDYPILIKINCDDFMEEGLTFTESKYVCEELAKKGVDAIEISGGSGSARDGKGASRTKIKTSEDESYFRDYAAQVASEVDVPIILVGGNRSFEVMNDILENTEIDYFSLSRPLLAEPNLINRWKSEDKSKAKCISCNQCFSGSNNNCVVY
ncbi:NADH:flavin oxidoreductase [Halanaerocella petrolearia]